jgi:hypothetical protein
VTGQEGADKRNLTSDRENIMTYYSPQLIQTMRDALDAVMTKVPMSHATPGLKAHLAEVILQAAAQGLTSMMAW